MTKAERPIDRALRWAKEAGMNHSDFAKRMGVVPQHITNWKSRGMPAEHHAKAAQITNHSVDELLGLVSERSSAHSGEVRSSRIPVVGTAQLGEKGYWTETEHPTGTGDGYINVPSRDQNAYAVRVVGDSMHPRIKSGEYVVLEPNHTCVPGDEVLVVTKDGRSMVKEFLYRRDGLVALQSVNLAHARLTLSETDIEKMHYVAAISKAALYSSE